MNVLIWKGWVVVGKKPGQLIQNSRIESPVCLFRELKLSERFYIILSWSLFMAIYF